MASPLSLSDLPEATLLSMLRQLEGTELAALCVQDRRLRQLGSEQSLWHALALNRWPIATAEHHGGDWRRLYRQRARLPRALVGCVDRIHSLTSQAAGGGAQLRLNGSSLPGAAPSPSGSPVRRNVYGVSDRPFVRLPGMIFEQLMHELFSACLWKARVRDGCCGSADAHHHGLKLRSGALFGGATGSATSSPGGSVASGSSACSSACSSNSDSSSSSSNDSSMRSSSHVAESLDREMALVRADLAWWLDNKPEAVLQFVRRTASLLSDWDMWGGGFSSWPEVLWRRSALQFLSDMMLLMGPELGVCPSVTGRVTRELERLDDAMRSVDGEASDLACCRRPEGLPLKHWWYSLTGSVGAGTLC